MYCLVFEAIKSAARADERREPTFEVPVFSVASGGANCLPTHVTKIRQPIRTLQFLSHLESSIEPVGAVLKLQNDPLRLPRPKNTESVTPTLSPQRHVDRFTSNAGRPLAPPARARPNLHDHRGSRRGRGLQGRYAAGSEQGWCLGEGAEAEG
jgi:hypothetical protein